MSIYSNVTEQDLNSLRKLAEQHKNQHAPKIKNRLLKQIHDIKLAENLSPITQNINEVKKIYSRLRRCYKKITTRNTSTSYRKYSYQSSANEKL